jgi:hypothetical protein
MEVKQCAALMALEARISPNLQGITSFKIHGPFKTVTWYINYVGQSREKLRCLLKRINPKLIDNSVRGKWVASW